MDLVKRYIAAVQRELPESKRADIGRELQANILDEIDAQKSPNDSISEQQIADILRKMGDPRSVAWQFCPPRPLIAGHLMPIYQYTLYMVLAVLLLLQLVKAAIITLTAPELQLWLFIKGVLSGWLEGALLAFTAITLTYSVISAEHKKSPRLWDPLKLPAADASWRQVRLSDVFTDLATYLFLLVMISYSWWQQWLYDVTVASPFSPAVLSVLYVFIPVLLLGIANSLWQLYRRFWSRGMLVANIAINLAFAGFIGWLAFHGPVLELNPSNWQGIVKPDDLARIISTSLVIVALFPAYELIRDIRRLQGAGS